MHLLTPQKVSTPAIALLLLVLTFLCHGLSLKADFMADDFYYLQPDKVALNYRELPDFFLNTPGHHYNPLDVILNYHLFRTSLAPSFLYGFNLILFFLNSLLLFFNIKIWTGDRTLAALTAILFTIHPINAENLSHITFNTVFFSAIFLQLSMLGFWYYLSSAKAQKGWYFASLLSYLLSLLFLETALLFPGYLCAFCLLKPVQERLRSLSLTLPFWTLSFAYFALWSVMTRDGHLLSDKITHLNISLASYTATSALLIKWYLGNLFFPDDPVFIKSSAVLIENLAPWIVGLLVGIATAVFFMIRWHKSTKGVALLWFSIGFIFMIPASLIHAYSMGMVIEPHWFFFSSMGFFLFFALILQDIKPHINIILYRGLLSVIIFFWVITSYRHHIIARTEISYLEYWLEVSPGNSIPALRLGSLYGLTDSLKIPETLIGDMERQADLYIQKKQYPEASALIEKLIISKPQHKNLQLWQYTLTALDQKLGQRSTNSLTIEAFRSQKMTVAEYLLISTKLDRVEMREQAIYILDLALNYYPDNPELLCLKALILANQHDFDGSEALLRLKIQEFPADPKFLILLKEIQALKVKNSLKIVR